MTTNLFAWCLCLVRSPHCLYTERGGEEGGSEGESEEEGGREGGEGGKRGHQLT